jgi:hypothetical protein
MHLCGGLLTTSTGAPSPPCMNYRQNGRELVWRRRGFDVSIGHTQK